MNLSRFPISESIRLKIALSEIRFETDDEFKKSFALHFKKYSDYFLAESDLKNLFNYNSELQKSLLTDGLKKIQKLVYRKGKYFFQTFWVKREIAPGYSPEIDLSKPRKIKTLHTFLDDLKVVNQNFKKDIIWRQNCQRCVPTYELRRRGFDAVALPCKDLSNDFLANNWWKVWKEPVIHHCRFGSGLVKIKEKMESFPNGARIEIYVRWNNHFRNGHVFIAEKIDDKVHFIDPQTNCSDVEFYFDAVLSGNTMFLRIDNLEFDSNMIRKCSKWRNKKNDNRKSL